MENVHRQTDHEGKIQNQNAVNWLSITNEHVSSIGKNWLIFGLVLQFVVLILLQIPMVWVPLF